MSSIIIEIKAPQRAPGLEASVCHWQRRICKTVIKASQPGEMTCFYCHNLGNSVQ